jgi:hypothetical protein
LTKGITLKNFAEELPLKIVELFTMSDNGLGSQRRLPFSFKKSRQQIKDTGISTDKVCLKAL